MPTPGPVSAMLFPFLPVAIGGSAFPQHLAFWGYVWGYLHPCHDDKRLNFKRICIEFDSLHINRTGTHGIPIIYRAGHGLTVCFAVACE